MSQPEHLASAIDYLYSKGIPQNIDAAVILGSGLGSFGELIEDSTIIPYSDIPDFPQSTVEGHSGSLIYGSLSGKKVLAFSGRFHFYEGYGFKKTILPVQIAAALNAGKLIISNAAGGINLDFRVGDLMIIENIIRHNFMIAPSQPEPWKYNLYDYAVKVEEIAESIGIAVKKGSYLYVKGPNYETKAEIHAFRKMLGDAVGMSTAPELIEACRLDLKTVAISLITNAAAGVIDQKLDHNEVKEAADAKKDEFARLVTAIIEQL